MGQDKKRPKGADTIDANLRRVYQDVLNEAVPDRFLALLDQLRAQDATALAKPAETGDETGDQAGVQADKASPTGGSHS